MKGKVSLRETWSVQKAGKKYRLRVPSTTKIQIFPKSFELAMIMDCEGMVSIEILKDLYIVRRPGEVRIFRYQRDLLDMFQPANSLTSKLLTTWWVQEIE